MAINSLSSASRGIAGLASGINTEETVSKLLAGTQSKIDRASQKKATLINKQSMFREVSAKLKTLQTSFMSFSSKTNLLSSNFFNNMSATLRAPVGKNPAFSVTASSDTQAGTYKLNSIKQLASAHSMKTNEAISGKVDGKLSQSVAESLVKKAQGGDTPADATMVIKVGDQSVTFENAPELFGGKSANEVVNIINQKFAGANVAGKASFVNNKLTIHADDPKAYISVHGNTADEAVDKVLAMKMFGNEPGLSAQGTFAATISTDQYLPSITVNLDGRQQSVYLDLGALRKLAGTDASGNPVASDGGSALVANLENSLRQTFGTGVKVSVNNGTINFATDSSSSKLTITGSTSTISVLGIKSGTSNKLNSNLAISDLNFKDPLQGNLHSFSINGVDFSYTANTALSTIINDVNSSKAGVKISYLEAEDKFVIQRSETGATDPNGPPPIDIEQTNGNLMSVLFGEEGGSGHNGFAIHKTMTSDSAVSADQYEYGGYYSFNVNGRNYTFNVPKKGDGATYTSDEFMTEINKHFRNNFGVLPDGTSSVSMSFANDKFSIASNSKNVVVKSVATNPVTNPFSLGFSEGSSTVVNSGGTTLADAGVVFGDDGYIRISTGPNPGDVVELRGADIKGKTMDQLAVDIQQALQASSSAATVTFDKNSSAFQITGVGKETSITIEGGTNGKDVEKLFGSSSLKIKAAEISGFSTIAEGQNSIAFIDGIEITRSSNTFDYNGMSFTLQSLYNPNDGAAGEATEVIVSRDTKAIVDGVKEYLKQYNETVDYLNGLYKADTTYKDYPPLSADQKASMSESEIKSWEEKSKEGLLRGDERIGRILQSMRSSMYTRPEDSTIAIYDLGISTSYYSKDGNFDLTSDSDLQAMLEQDPDAVMKLFAGTGGLMDKVNTSINEAISASIASPGYLTREAGANSLDTDSNIYKQIKEIDSQLVTLEDRYWNEYDRYWKQFNQMEQMLQQMNQQSSWLASSLGGG